MGPGDLALVHGPWRRVREELCAGRIAINERFI